MDDGEEKRRRRRAPSSTAGKLQLRSWAPDPRTRKERELGFEIVPGLYLGHVVNSSGAEQLPTGSGSLVKADRAGCRRGSPKVV